LTLVNLILEARGVCLAGFRRFLFPPNFLSALHRIRSDPFAFAFSRNLLNFFLLCAESQLAARKRLVGVFGARFDIHARQR
jgi:hypothetical protein